jgi:hypothetical protein
MTVVLDSDDVLLENFGGSNATFRTLKGMKTSDYMQSNTWKEPDPCDCRNAFRIAVPRRALLKVFLSIQAVCLFLTIILTMEVFQHKSNFQSFFNEECLDDNSNSPTKPTDSISRIFDDLIDEIPSKSKETQTCSGKFIRRFDQTYTPALGGDSVEERFNFDFSISTPISPTRPLLLMVYPEVSDDCDAHYSFKMHSGRSSIDKSMITGVYSTTIKSSTSTNNQPSMLLPSTDKKYYYGTIVDHQVHGNEKDRSYRMIVEQPTQDISNTQCDYGESWKQLTINRLRPSFSSFNGSKIFSLGKCLLVLCVIQILFACTNYYYVNTPSTIHPWMISSYISTKFLLIDLPLQIVSLVYLSDWYGKSGERCQISITGDKESQVDTFNMNHSLLFGVIFASTIFYQYVLVNQKASHELSVDMKIVQMFTRLSIASISMLPTMIGLLIFKSDIIYMPGLIHAIVIAPVFIAILSLCVWICVPFALFIENSDY